MICPRCGHGVVVRFDPRDDDPACLACGHVVYQDEPLAYVEDGRKEARAPSYAASVAVDERLREAQRRYDRKRRKKRGAPPHRRGIVL